jgi:hypothetical protein
LKNKSTKKEKIVGRKSNTCKVNAHEEEEIMQYTHGIIPKHARVRFLLRIYNGW